ncbi:MAG TPA: hypothetical protein VK763_09720 [Terriglobales bacterium]|jgi:hypothetical protein|nr:hypothetical protein [Terriglobales bacterium]
MRATSTTATQATNIDIYFCDVFHVDPNRLEAYGAFNISVVNDLPLFVDPFLLFNSTKSEYRVLHDEMIRYLQFLRDKAAVGAVDEDLIEYWFTFHEVKQNWLGFSKSGNTGSGLGIDFARALYANLNTVFKSFGQETITKGSHLEKLTLIRSGVGKDNISDFTTNLIKRYLLEYTQTFARDHIPSELCHGYNVPKVSFNYETAIWENSMFTLPCYRGDFVILTPKDILTKDETWINRLDLIDSFELIADSLPNGALRALINSYFREHLPKKPSDREVVEAKVKTIQQYPEIIEYYIREKEDDGDQAQSVSSRKVRETEHFFIDQVKILSELLLGETEFYSTRGDTYAEARDRVQFLKDVIENKDGYRFFWRDGQPIRKEDDLQVLYRLTWFGTPSDINREVNNGRGAVDFKVSRGSVDKSLVECKLASNSKLRRNLANQVAIYQKASDAPRALKVIIYFTETELTKVRNILKELGLSDAENIILIDARRDNKPSASTA